MNLRHTPMLLPMIALLAGCYASHGRERDAVRPPRPDAHVPEAPIAACDEATLGDGCALPAGAACVRIADGAPAPMDAMAFIATGILDLQLTTEGVAREEGCTISYTPGPIDRVAMAFRGERRAGSWPIALPCPGDDCAQGFVAAASPAGPVGGTEADAGTLTLDTFEELEGGRVCGSFILTADGAELARGGFHAALRICDL